MQKCTIIGVCRLNSACKINVYIVWYNCTRGWGGLPPCSTGAMPDYRKRRLAVSLYEILMVAIAAIRIVYDILSDLLRRWKKGSE